MSEKREKPPATVRIFGTPVELSAIPPDGSERNRFAEDWEARPTLIPYSVIEQITKLLQKNPGRPENAQRPKLVKDAS